MSPICIFFISSYAISQGPAPDIFHWQHTKEKNAGNSNNGAFANLIEPGKASPTVVHKETSICEESRDIVSRCIDELFYDDVMVGLEGGQCLSKRIVDAGISFPEFSSIIGLRVPEKEYLCAKHFDFEEGTEKSEIGKCVSKKLEETATNDLHKLKALVEPQAKLVYKYYTEYRGKFSYKDIRWGMSKKEVKKILGSMVCKKDCVQKGKTSGYASVTSLEFHDDKLYKIVVAFEPSTFAPDAAIRVYREIDELLIAKYGVPDETYDTTDGDEMREIFGESRAIQYGKKVVGNKWSVEETTISHIAIGQDMTVFHVIIYESDVLTGVAKRHNIMKNMADL